MQFQPTMRSLSLASLTSRVRKSRTGNTEKKNVYAADAPGRPTRTRTKPRFKVKT